MKTLTMTNGSDWVKISLSDQFGGVIESNLKGPLIMTLSDFNGAVDALESLVLAHACNGIDVEAEAYQKGFWTAVEKISEMFG